MLESRSKRQPTETSLLGTQQESGSCWDLASTISWPWASTWEGRGEDSRNERCCCELVIRLQSENVPKDYCWFSLHLTEQGVWKTPRNWPFRAKLSAYSSCSTPLTHEHVIWLVGWSFLFLRIFQTELKEIIMFTSCYCLNFRVMRNSESGFSGADL